MSFFFYWCGQRDSNPYTRSDTSTSSLPVCQFQHSRKSQSIFNCVSIILLKRRFVKSFCTSNNFFITCFLHNQYLRLYDSHFFFDELSELAVFFIFEAMSIQYVIRLLPYEYVQILSHYAYQQIFKRKKFVGIFVVGIFFFIRFCFRFFIFIRRLLRFGEVFSLRKFRDFLIRAL